MTRHEPDSVAGPADAEVDIRGSRSSGRSALLGGLDHPDNLLILAMAAIFVALIVPAGWLFAFPCCFGLIIWSRTRRHRLPFRLPMSWRAPDYSNPEPGHSRRFRDGQGLLHLGNDFASNEELWITNSDARRHALVLGTTGAGKALPIDTLVLTERGWIPNGDIRPGDKLFRPGGGTTAAVSVHPQGRLPVVRLNFADGRFADCSRDHLWMIRICGGCRLADDELPQPALMTAADIALMIEACSGLPDSSLRSRLYIPMVRALDGPCVDHVLTSGTARSAGLEGLDALPFAPALSGRGADRLDWACCMLRTRLEGSTPRVSGSSLVIPVLNGADGRRLRELLWSLGGTAVQLLEGDRILVVACFPGQEGIMPGIPACSCESMPGLEITGVEVFAAKSEPAAGGVGAADQVPAREVEMSCIRTDAPDGLFVIENHIVTHNTELLLGIAAQSMMWSSGFMFIDGKGTTEFHARVWSLVSRFGRQDDYRMLNFTDAGSHPDDPAGGPAVHSNTLNPFSHGSADQLMNLVVSLMGEGGSAGDLWKGRAMSLVTSAMKALCEMRDAGDVLLDVQSIRDFLPLGIGPKPELLGGRKIRDVSEIPVAAWDDIKSRGGMIELYLRAQNGEFSERSRLALKGFFDSLPGFNYEAALNGGPQQGKAVEQHGFLSMQLTRPLGSLADDFGHIFRTPFGEVDIEDVVLNRRILVVLLPALQKAPTEMRNCGKIVVSMLKMMMGRAAGSALEGTKLSLVDARPTRSNSPFIAVLDEAGYYMVKGIDIMMAQARSLGFMIIIAGQDMASMQSVSPQVAETAAANARLTAAGATEDAQRTWGFLKQKFASHVVPVAGGRTARTGLLGTRWVERPDVTFTVRERVSIGDLQKLREGEFYFLMESRLVKARAFHVSENWTPWIAMNKFLLIRGPTDRAPGLDQTAEIEFQRAVEAIGRSIIDPVGMERRKKALPFDPRDALNCAVEYSKMQASKVGDGDSACRNSRDADLLGMLFGVAHRIVE